MMLISKARLVDTIIIKHDSSSHMRGYSLVGREFVLKEVFPVRRKAKTLDGAEIEDQFYVIDLPQYLKVVPEANNSRFDNNEVLIPVFAAMRSFRPEYHKG